MNAPVGPREFEGLVAIVTGGSSGIGEAIAQELHTRGASVWILDRDASTDATARTVQCDVSDEDSVRRAVHFVSAEAGRIDVVAANAGIGAQGTIEDNDDEEWRRVFEVNVFGAARIARETMAFLKQSPSGALIFTSSIAGGTGLPDRALYSATKGALNALTLALAADGLAAGVRVNAVAPGTADTPWIGRLLAAAPDPDAEKRALSQRQPTGRLVAPQEVADAVAYLASPRAGSTTGVILPVDGGMHSLRPRPNGTR